MELDLAVSWAPQSCTLPTAERPLRVAEFDELFARAVQHAERIDQTRLRLGLDPTADVAARVADLVVRETACCSFFTFTLIVTNGALDLEVSVPIGQVAVLDALAARAEASS